MDIASLGFAAAVSAGATLGVQAARTTIDFASVLSEKLTTPASQQPLATTPLVSTDESGNSPNFTEALTKFDAFLHSIGLSPNHAREVEAGVDSTGQPTLHLNAVAWEPWQQASLQDWIDDNSQAAKALGIG